MNKGQDYDYHVHRARAEMDCAYRAAGHAAVAAHMKLSALHMDRARTARQLAGGMPRSEVEREGLLSRA
jgi:hypothetical protein